MYQCVSTRAPVASMGCYAQRRHDMQNRQNSSDVRSGSVALSSTRLYYDVLGEGPALVLIHGGYMDRRMWDDQFAPFAEHYHVIRYDVRGFGESPLPQEA